MKGLPFGRDLACQVCFTSAAGVGEWSDRSDPMRTLGPLTIPMKAPHAVDDACTMSSVLLEWTPAEIGPSDAPVDHYEVTCAAYS